MEIPYPKIVTLAMLFIGEALAIYAEIKGARGNNFVLQPFLQIFLLITVAGGFILAGYILGYSAFKNIWTVSALSVTSILMIEPILAWTLFHQMPTNGAIAGFILGMLGLFFSIFF